MPAFFTNLVGTSPSSGLAREERLTDFMAPACPTLNKPALFHVLWLLQLHTDIATFPKLPGGPVNVRERPGDSWPDTLL